MRPFRDALGRDWNLHITCWEERCLRELHGVDLLDVKSFGQAVDNTAKLVECLWSLCQEKAMTVGVTEQQFLRGLAGDEFGEAREAFVQAAIDFFPNAQAREMMRSAWGSPSPSKSPSDDSPATPESTPAT